MSFTAEQIAELTEALAPTLESKVTETVAAAMKEPINGALTKRFAQFEKGLDKTVGESITKALDGFKSNLPATQQQGGGGQSSGGQQDPAKEEYAVKLKTVETRLTDALTRLDEADKRVVAERAKNREAVKRDVLSKTLRDSGFQDPKGLDFAVNHLMKVEGRVEYESDEDTAKVLWKTDDGGFTDLAAGVKKWAGTPDAKYFMPATNTRGSGANPPRGNAGFAGNGQKLTERQIQDNVLGALVEKLDEQR